MDAPGLRYVRGEASKSPSVIHTALRIGLLCLTLLTGRISAAENRFATPVSRTRTDVHSFVNWNFWHRNRLRGWLSTEMAIRKTLEQWFARRPAHTLIENGSPSELRDFFQALPTRADCDLSIVYLASHQAPDGLWEFVQRERKSLSAIVAGADIPGHPFRIVIVDACYAAVLQAKPDWVRAMGYPTLFAALASEETYELNFRGPRSDDLRRRYPAASAWLDEQMGGEWNGRLSFLGFVWVQTFLTARRAPTDRAGWSEFLRRCGETAEEFRRNGDSRLASQVTPFSGAGGRR